MKQLGISSSEQNGCTKKTPTHRSSSTSGHLASLWVSAAVNLEQHAQVPEEVTLPEHWVQLINKWREETTKIIKARETKLLRKQ
jgi:hypothetical protein